MKLALLFLLAFVATSHQQRFKNRMLWTMPQQQQVMPYHRGFYDDPYNYLNNIRRPLARHQDFIDIVREAAADDEDGTIEIINPSSTIPYSSDDYENEEDHRPLMNGRLMFRQQYSSPYMQFYDYINSYNSRKHSNIEFDQLYNNMIFRNHPFYQYQQPLGQQTIEPRRRFNPSSSTVAAADPRSFLDSVNDIVFPGNSQKRLFGKTQGVISTSTVNITKVISCVSSTEFVSGRLAPACRRRRHGMEHLLAFDDLIGSSPSLYPTAVEKVETTLAPDSEEQYEKKNARLNELLASSKDELIIEDVDDENGRVKRWFGYKYVATTTLTTYTFFSTTVTKTVVLLTAATTSALTCLPYGFTVC